jgi:Xaa-Pro aminopeptidase
MKIKEAKAILAEKKLDAIVLFSKSPSFRYLLGEKLDWGIIVITKKEAVVFISPLSAGKYKGFNTIRVDKLVPEMQALMKKHKVKKIGLDEAYTSVRQRKFIGKHGKTLDTSEALDSLRETKFPEEIKNMKKACEITDEVFSLIIKNFSNFKTEKDIARFIQIEFIKRDCELAFDSIAASGKNAAVAHHEPQDVLHKGFLVLDFGAKYKGYCADMTRTIYLGTPSQKEIELYERVMNINASCIEIARPGVAAKDVHNHAVKMFGKDAKYFIHSIGHGLGTEVHELPQMYSKSNKPLKKDSVITIEPGYYDEKKGIGIRIEDDLYLGNKKEILTKSTKDLICIK